MLSLIKVKSGQATMNSELWSKKNTFLAIGLLVIFIIIALFLIIRMSRSKLDNFTSETSVVWETYTDDIFQYSIDYPSGWKLDLLKEDALGGAKDNQKLTISKDGYKLTVVWYSKNDNIVSKDIFLNTAIPEVCIFDDQERGEGDLEFLNVNYCEGKYLDLKDKDGIYIRRRLELPDILNGYASWRIYTFKDGTFINDPLITINAPPNYKRDNLFILDQMVLGLRYY